MVDVIIMWHNFALQDKCSTPCTLLIIDHSCPSIACDIIFLTTFFFFAISNFTFYCNSTSMILFSLSMLVSLYDCNKLCDKQQTKKSGTKETCKSILVKSFAKSFFAMIEWPHLCFLFYKISKKICLFSSLKGVMIHVINGYLLSPKRVGGKPCWKVTLLVANKPWC